MLFGRPDIPGLVDMQIPDLKTRYSATTTTTAEITVQF